MLSAVPQWKDFMGPGGLDPIKDFDRILIAGPQLRRSSEVAAVIRYNVDDSRIRESIDRIVRRDKERGRWLDAGVPAAQARADGAERHFVMLPRSDIVIVTPPSASAHAMSLGDTKMELPPAAGGEILYAKVATPWRVFIGLPVDVPKSIATAEVTLHLTPRGGVSIDLVLADASADQARQNAESLASAIRSQPIVFGLTLAGGPPRIEFRAKESEIHGHLELTSGQVSMVLDIVDAFLTELAARRAARKARTLADGGVTASGAGAGPPVRSLSDSGATRAPLGDARDAGAEPKERDR
jgi:hypothetical protein